MTERWTTSKDKLARAAAVSGLAAGLTATSLIGGPTANAWCVGISGINIGAGCASTLGNIALGLGPNAVANSNGLSLAVALGDAVADSTGVLTLAMAGGTSEADTNGIANVAVAAGTGDVTAIAGSLASDFLNFAVNFGNATSPAVSLVEADFGGLNVAANLGGNANSQNGTFFDMTVFAGGASADSRGFGTVALNLLGNRNDIEAFGVLDAAINLGGLFAFPNGSNTTIHVGQIATNEPANLGVGFNWQPPVITPACEGLCGNTVTSNGNLGIAGAIGLVNETVAVTGPRIAINTPLNPPALAATAASSTVAKARASLRPASSTLGKASASPAGSTLAKARASLSPASSKKNAVGGTQAKSSVKSVSDRLTTSAKKLSARVGKVTGAGTKSGAAGSK